MKIYNSLTRKKEEFIPLKKNLVGMYVCGPTVYDEPHIGHARSAYIFDVIRRYLAYKGYDVKFVRNVTDVDDKIIEKAKSAVPAHETKGGALSHQPSAISLVEATKEISEKYLAAYHEDMALLGIGNPDKEPRATRYIPKMIKFIELLIERGCAYAAGGDVYFNIKKAPLYGKLSNQNIDKMETGARPVRSNASNGARIAPGEKKQDGLDFALWKKAKVGEPSWDSPWGKGRPGWHIECSVMSSDILGDEFDIHGGGIDLIFPHHENEIAQSEGAGEKFAKYWIHNGLLTINGEKMAKSLGNFISIKDFLNKYKDPDYLKLFFLSAHYSSPIDYTEEKILEAKKAKERFLILFEKLDRVTGSGIRVTGRKADKGLEKFKIKFEEAMDDDFNTPLALASLFDLVTYANKSGEFSGIKKLLVDLTSVFGLNLSKGVSEPVLSEKEIKKLIEDRNRARNDKDFKKGDEIRKALMGKGVILEDTKDGTLWRRKI